MDIQPDQMASAVMQMVIADHARGIAPEVLPRLAVLYATAIREGLQALFENGLPASEMQALQAKLDAHISSAECWRTMILNSLATIERMANHAIAISSHRDTSPPPASPSVRD